MLPFYSDARVISQLLTISIWTEIAGPGTEQKGKVFPEEGNWCFGNTWNVTSLWADLRMWWTFEMLRQLSRLKLWTEWKDAKSAPSRDISDKCVIVKKSRWRKQTHLIPSHNNDDSHKCAFLMHMLHNSAVTHYKQKIYQLAKLRASKNNLELFVWMPHKMHVMYWD